MIASLRGTVQSVAADSLVLEVGGVGYLVQASGLTLRSLQTGDEVLLRTDMQVRQDAILLFGFETADEQSWFRLLLSVQGVGGRLALSILGTLPPEQLAHAISTDDRAALARAPGVGARTAARIVGELRDKAGELPAAKAPVSGPAGEGDAGALADALSALEHLGFRPADAQRAVSEAARALGPVPAPHLIREALKRARS